MINPRHEKQLRTRPAKPSKHKWQHFLPQMYLRGFVDPNRVAKGQHDLWVYRLADEPKARGPKGVAAEPHFYTTAELPDTPTEGEKGLAEVEDVAVKHLEKLRSGDINLTPQEKAEFATYVGIQMTRTPLARDRANAIAIELMRQGWKKTLDEGKLGDLVTKLEAKTGQKIGTNLVSLEEFARRIADGTAEMSQESKGWNMKHMFDQAVTFGGVLERMHWGLLEAPVGAAFITSDNPVHVADPPAKAAGSKGFTFSNQMQVAFPLSPRFLLFCDFVPRPDERAALTADQVRRFNTDQIEYAYREVYASFRSDELQAEVDCVFNARPSVEWKLPPDVL